MSDSSMRSVAQAAAPATLDLDDFDALLMQEFKPRTDKAKDLIQAGVRALAEQALADSKTRVVPENAIRTIENYIAAIDEVLGKQLNQILHHPEFQRVESAWRGLHYMVSRTETDEMLKIRVLNVSKDEVARTLKRYDGITWDQSPLFKKIYEAEYGQSGGEPYGCIVADYFFDHTAPDVELLRGMAKIAGAAHAPLITGASPTAMQMETWQDLGNPADLAKIFGTQEYAAWRDLRQSEDARYIGLCMPRFMGRLPYGEKTNRVQDLVFEEDTGRGDQEKYVWLNAAYAMATNITRAFKESGWCVQIRGQESGGLVENLPAHTYKTDDGGVDMTCPTEVAISDRREKELSNLGFMGLVHKKNTNMAAFIGGQSLQEPAEFTDDKATANARLSARLPYIFAVCRFAHYLKCMVRDKIGKNMEAADAQRWLSEWITGYVCGDPATASPSILAQRPLSAAEVIVEADEADPGHYKATFRLRPHFQLESMDVSLRLVSQLPTKGT
jgi:type VI secretion system protein ImpC